MNLPNDLRLALASELAAAPQKNMANIAGSLSARYRTKPQQGAEKGPLLRSQADVLAYAAYRMPATFAAVYASLVEVHLRRPDWHPHTLLDVGSGPGTAMWATSEIWPELERVTLLERDESMIEFGKRLSTHAQAETVHHALWRKVDLLGQWNAEPHELVTIAYALGELPTSQRKQFANRLWSITTDTLVIVEPGTPVGFSHIREARQQLIEAGAIVIAPCPHALSCPMPGNDWCHFAQRISRTQLHRQVKNATLSYEDEKFSYIAVSRHKGLPIAGRVIRHPQIRPGHIHLELCTPDGLQQTVATRKDKEAFRQARDLRWGDALSRDNQ